MPPRPSALYVFHVALISTGILFCFGFALYAVSPYSRSGDRDKTLLALFFTAAGVGLGFYLRSVLRYGLRGRPPDLPEDEE
jgi:heme/copper-type cytochrome/quinol oxidase subunit 3